MYESVATSSNPRRIISLGFFSYIPVLLAQILSISSFYFGYIGKAIEFGAAKCVAFDKHC